MKFYLGIPEPAWLKRTDVPLFLSHRRLRRLKAMPVARGPWALDSGGFTEIGMHGRWTITPEEYIEAVARYAEEVGHLEWASPQDWMCEPQMIEKTGLSVREHQERTVENLMTLRALAPELPFVPVLQGWDQQDYLTCIDLYTEAGVDLTTEPLVGVGSVCRRESTDEIGAIVGDLAEAGISLHGFGVKRRGLRKYGQHLTSADSMAWSFAARRLGIRLDEQCPHLGDCRNCLRWALAWRDQLIEAELQQEAA